MSTPEELRCELGESLTQYVKCHQGDRRVQSWTFSMIAALIVVVRKIRQRKRSREILA